MGDRGGGSRTVILDSSEGSHFLLCFLPPSRHFLHFMYFAPLHFPILHFLSPLHSPRPSSPPLCPSPSSPLTSHPLTTPLLLSPAYELRMMVRRRTSQLEDALEGDAELALAAVLDYMGCDDWLVDFFLVSDIDSATEREKGERERERESKRYS
jgi:hypothetical protein